MRAKIMLAGARTMRHFLYAFLIALTNNVDNIGARIAYSIRGVKITAPINLWISLITFVISFLAAFSGTKLSGSLGHTSSFLSMALLTAMGSKMILEQYVGDKCGESPFQKRWKGICHILGKPLDGDKDNSRHLDFKEATLLGIALSINNVGGGLSAGMIGLNAFLVGFLSAALSFLALSAGNRVAEFFIKRNISGKAAIAGGILLIAIGIEQILF
jgi:putative sporulation protein YtaF